MTVVQHIQYAAPVSVLVFVTSLASCVPARRAARVDPNLVLRSE